MIGSLQFRYGIITYVLSCCFFLEILWNIILITISLNDVVNITYPLNIVSCIPFTHSHNFLNIISCICQIKQHRLSMFKHTVGEIVLSKHVFGFTILIPLLLTLNLRDCTKGYVLIFYNLHFAMFFLNPTIFVYLLYKHFPDWTKIIIITSLKLDFSVLADNTSECPTNFYKEGNDCKGITCTLF